MLERKYIFIRLSIPDIPMSRVVNGPVFIPLGSGLSPRRLIASVARLAVMLLRIPEFRIRQTSPHVILGITTSPEPMVRHDVHVEAIVPDAKRDVEVRVANLART